MIHSESYKQTLYFYRLIFLCAVLLVFGLAIHLVVDLTWGSLCAAGAACPGDRTADVQSPGNDGVWDWATPPALGTFDLNPFARLPLDTRPTDAGWCSPPPVRPPLGA